MLNLFDIAPEVGAVADVGGAEAVGIGVSVGRPDVRAPVVGWAVWSDAVADVPFAVELADELDDEASGPTRKKLPAMGLPRLAI